MESVLLDVFTELGPAGVVGVIFYLLGSRLITKHEKDMDRCHEDRQREIEAHRNHFVEQERLWNDRLNDCVDDKVNYLKHLNDRNSNG